MRTYSIPIATNAMAFDELKTKLVIRPHHQRAIDRLADAYRGRSVRL
jgi:hypothetical protein